MDTLCCTCCDRHAQKHLSKLSLFAAQRVERVNALRNSLKIHIDGSDVPEPIADLATLAARPDISAKLIENFQAMGWKTLTPTQMQVRCRQPAVPLAPHAVTPQWAHAGTAYTAAARARATAGACAVRGVCAGRAAKRGGAATNVLSIPFPAHGSAAPSPRSPSP